MSYHETLRTTLPRLSPRMRSALAAACAQRVFDVLHDDDRSPVDVAKQALAMTWRFAQGDNVDEKDYEAMYQATAQVQLDTAEQQDTEFNYAMRTVLEALVTVHRHDTDPAEAAAYHLIDTAGYADRDNSDAAIDEETEWLLQALELAEQREDDAIDPELFDAIGSTPPAWLLRWEQR